MFSFDKQHSIETQLTTKLSEGLVAYRKYIKQSCENNYYSYFTEYMQQKTKIVKMISKKDNKDFNKAEQFVQFHELFLYPLWIYHSSADFTVNLKQHFSVPVNNFMIWLAFINQLLAGKMERNKLEKLELGEHSLLEFYVLQIVRGAILFVLIPLEIPILSNKGELKGFKYVQSLKFMNKQIYYQAYKMRNMAKQFLRNSLIERNLADMEFRAQAQIPADMTYFTPLMFDDLLLTPEEAAKYIYDEKRQRWLNTNVYQQFKKQDEDQESVLENQYIVKKYADFSSAAKLVELIQNIPNFKIQMTEEEKEVVSANGDVIVIGRSGTGKTTCAILRLFSMNMLFKLRVNLLCKKQFIEQINLEDDFSSNALRSIFITSSPVLACEVKRYYKSITQHLQTQINKKRSKPQSQEQNVDIDNLEQSTIQYIQSVNETKQEQDEEFEKIDEEESDTEIEDYEVEEYEKEMGNYNKFSDIKAYPVFFTLRKLILLIDASLVNPYFKRNNSEVKQKRSAYWHNEQSGTLMINRNIVQAVNLEMDGDFIPLKTQQQRLTETPEVQEVTYEIFKLQFWPLIQKNLKEDFKRTEFQPDAQHVWSQIYSQIKGSSNSYQCAGMCLNQYVYTYNFSKERIDRGNVIYKCFIQYENLKRKLRYYDILDVVNYISVQLDKKLHCFVPLHYLIVDEMQDLPMAVFSMLSKIVQLGLYLSGDTAQNIVKGVGFRSSEIKQMLVRTPRIVKENEVSIYNLTFNFRSHNSILQLANSVISLLELCFPKNIDRLQKETSNWDGPKPIILQCEDQESLFLFLQNGSTEKKIEFGCNQTILVKQQDSKRQVPQLLQHAIILTIYEAKGLEFEDVILYNFFSDDYLGKQAWNILKYLEVIEQTVSQKEYENIIYRRQEETSIVEFSDIHKEKITIKRLGLNKKYGNISEADMSLCQSLLSELKLLYVAITRPKNRLIIYDQNPECRSLIQKIWVELGLVQVIDQKDQVNRVGENQIFQKITASKQEWKNLGQKMFKQGHFSQALKCFKIVEDVNLINKAQAFCNAGEGVVLNQILDELKLQVKKKQVNQQIQQLTIEKNKIFKSAAECFILIDQKHRAAQCYFSAEEYSQALTLFTQLDCLQEMAETTFYLKDYKVSAKYFHELGDVYREIECYQQDEDYFSLIKVLNESKELIEQDLRSAYINKYFPLILNILTDKVEKAETNTQIIQEEDDDNDEISFEEVDDPQVIQQQPSEQFSIQDSQVDIANLHQSQLPIQDQTQSFSINQQQQQEVSEFENVSFFDPDDEWIQNDKQSIIQSIVSKESQKSDFSAILMANNPTIELVNTKNNIYVHEEVVQQLIQYFSAFSLEFKKHLLNQHNKAVHLSNRTEEDKHFDYMIDFILEIDSIDIDTIYLMIDILEEFKAYKLCIFVCNKFKLANKLGRYLVSVASEYSPFYQNGNTVSINMINNQQVRKNLLEQSIVSTYAVHNILETINPQFIQPKFENQPLTPYNSLGQQTYQEMITLGFWKKVLFQLDYENGLLICQAFQDQVNWKYLYMQNRMIVHKDEQMKQLEQNINFKINYFDLINFESPQTEVHYRLCVASYDHYIHHIIPYLIGLRRLPLNFLHNGDQIKIVQVDQLFDPSQINPLFKLSQLVFQAIINKSVISPEVLKQLISTELYKCSNDLIHKLKYFEASILSEIILQYSIIQPEQITKISGDDLIEFIDFAYKKHNKGKQYEEHHPSIFKVSKFNGPYLQQFQSYRAIHISSPLISILMKKIPQDLQFIDIHYEFMACPTEQIVAIIRQWQYQLQEQIFEIRANQLQKCLTYVHQVQLFDTQKLLYELSILVTMKSYNQNYRSGGLHDYYYDNFKWCDVPNQIEYYHDYLFYSQLHDRINLVFLNQLQFAHCRSNVKLNKIIVKKLSRIAMQQLFDSKLNSFSFHDAHRLITISILILNYCDQNQYALQFLQRYETKLGKKLKYRQFVEYLECRHYNCIDDQLDLYLDYYSQMKSVIDPQTIVNQQTMLSMQYLIAYSLKHSKEIIIPLHYLKFIGNTKILKPHTIFQYSASIQELQNQYFIEEILENINNLIVYSEDIILVDEAKLLIYVILLNLEQPTQEFLQQIEILWGSQKSSEKLKHCEEMVQQSKLDLISRRKVLLNKHSQIDLPFSEDFVCTVKIMNDETKLQEQYNNCLHQWESYDLINQHLKEQAIHLEQVIMKSNFINKVKSQDKHNGADEYNQFERLLNKSLRSFTNPIYLHYVNKIQLQIQDIQGNKKEDKILEIKKQFQLWLESNTQSDEYQRQAILQRNKKMLELKWLNLKAGIKVQKPKVRKIGK